MTVVLFFWAMLALNPGPVAAETKKEKELPSLFCVSAPTLFNKTQRCEDNHVFVRAAESCLKRLKTLVDEQSKNITFLKNKGSAQDQNFSTSAADYRSASSKLALLLHFAAMAAEEIDAYQDWILLPEHLDDPAFTKGNMEAYLKSMPCYDETSSSIDSVLADVQEIEDDLERIKKVADVHAATSGGYEGTLKSENLPLPKAAALQNDSSKVDAKQKPVVPVKPRKQNAPGTSGISGIKEKE